MSWCRVIVSMVGIVGILRACDGSHFLKSNDTPAADDSPLISVIMPTFNAQAYLSEAVDSILAQTYTNLELICVDGASKDKTLEILHRYQTQDSRVRIISRPDTGIVSALNDGLREVRGTFIARMDGDDLCVPERLALQVAYLQQNPDCVAVGTWVTRTTPNGYPVGEQKPPIDHEVIDHALIRGDVSVMIHGTTMFRSQALNDIGGWDDRFNNVEDLDLFLRLAEYGKLANVPQFLYRYRSILE